MSQVGVADRFWWRVLDARSPEDAVPDAADVMEPARPTREPPAAASSLAAGRDATSGPSSAARPSAPQPRAQAASSQATHAPLQHPPHVVRKSDADPLITSRVPLPWQVSVHTPRPLPAAPAAEPTRTAPPIVTSLATTPMPAMTLDISIAPIDRLPELQGRTRSPAKRPRWTARPRLQRLAIGCGVAGLVVVAVLVDGTGLRPQRSLQAEFDSALAFAGLAIDQVTITGHRMTNDDSVFQALDLGKAQSLFTLDTEAARVRVEALPWVASASIVRRFPAGLEVRIQERRPFALWRQADGRQHLIDMTGRVLSTIGAGQQVDLPLFAGEGAAPHASAIHAIIHQWPRLASDVHHFERVAGRRWDLVMRNGMRVLLPADGEAAALQELMGPGGRGAVLDLPLSTIDLRIAGEPLVSPLAMDQRLARVSPRG